jgi:hypothetical protein
MLHDTLERIWKQAVMAQSRYYPTIFQECLRKIKEQQRTAGISAEIWTQHSIIRVLTARTTCSVYKSLNFLFTNGREYQLPNYAEWSSLISIHGIVQRWGSQTRPLHYAFVSCTHICVHMNSEGISNCAGCHDAHVSFEVRSNISLSIDCWHRGPQGMGRISLHKQVLVFRQRSYMGRQAFHCDTCPPRPS